MVEGPPVCGAGAAGWRGACAASCCCHRCSCRRETRLLTAVAVPATAAVRAIPRSSPGIDASPLGVGLGRVEGGEDCLNGNAAAGGQLAAGAAHGGRERRGPCV